MTRSLLVAVLLTLTIAVAGRAGDADVAQRDVAKLSEQITDALVKGDLAFIDGIMAEDWVMISPEGVIEDRVQHLREIREGAVKYESMVKSDLKVRVYGNAAIVTGHIKSKLRVKGQLVGGSLSFSEVFTNREGKWQSVSVQLTRIGAQSQKP